MVRSSGVDVGMGVGGATNAVRSGAGGDAFALDPLTRNSLSQDGHSSPVQRMHRITQGVSSTKRGSSLPIRLPCNEPSGTQAPECPIWSCPVFGPVAGNLLACRVGPSESSCNCEVAAPLKHPIRH